MNVTYVRAFELVRQKAHSLHYYSRGISAHTTCLNNVYGTSIIMCLETDINCFAMAK